MVDEIGDCYADNCKIGRKFSTTHCCKDFEWAEDLPPQAVQSCGSCAFWQADEEAPADIGYCTRVVDK